MTFEQAHIEMDILLDKADQPYFTAYEKDKFLNKALMEWFEEQASVYDASGDNANMLGLYVMQDIGNTKEINEGSVGNNAAEQGIIIKINVSSSTITAIGTPGGSNNGTGSSQPYNLLANPHTEGGTRWPVFKILDLELGDYPTDTWACCKRTSMDQRPYDSGAFKDPFNRATTDYPKYFIRGGNIKITPNATTMFRLTYLTYPMPSNASKTNSAGVSTGFNSTHDYYGTTDVELGARCLSGTFGNWSELDWGPEEGIAIDEQKKIIKKAVRMMTANIESTSYPVQRQEEIENR